jgi:hypothetical protein
LDTAPDHVADTSRQSLPRKFNQTTSTFTSTVVTDIPPICR